MPITDTKVIDGKDFNHEQNEYFASKEDARIHASHIRKNYKWITGIRIQKRADGTYWIWWTNK